MQHARTLTRTNLCHISRQRLFKNVKRNCLLRRLFTKIQQHVHEDKIEPVLEQHCQNKETQVYAVLMHLKSHHSCDFFLKSHLSGDSTMYIAEISKAVTHICFHDHHCRAVRVCLRLTFKHRDDWQLLVRGRGSAHLLQGHLRRFQHACRHDAELSPGV